MQKKIARKIASITAVSLASGLITVPAGANADLTPNLQIMQKTEIISDEALDQSYQYDYQSDGNDQKFTQVETSWDNAFVAKKLVVGDWKNYDGDVVVSILKDDGMEYQLQTLKSNFLIMEKFQASNCSRQVKLQIQMLQCQGW